MKKLTKQGRLKELEKIAEKLGIGQNREVKCVACKRKIQFKEAIILTNKKEVTYLCKECNQKLEKGELNKKEIEADDILKQIEKIREISQPVPYKPEPPYEPKPIPWEPYPDKWKITPTYYTNKDRLDFNVFETTAILNGTALLKFTPYSANQTNTRK